MGNVSSLIWTPPSVLRLSKGNFSNTFTRNLSHVTSIDLKLGRIDLTKEFAVPSLLSLSINEVFMTRDTERLFFSSICRTSKNLRSIEICLVMGQQRYDPLVLRMIYSIPSLKKITTMFTTDEEIDLISKNIPGLEELNILGANNLTDISLHGLSQMTNLEMLRFHSVRQFTRQALTDFIRNKKSSKLEFQISNWTIEEEIPDGIVPFKW